MSFGENLQFLRKMHNGMTQEELAEKMNVSRQSISKWELNMAYPEMDKVLELCQYFSCSMDQLVRDDMTISNEAYSDIRLEVVDPFNYVSYTVISKEPEDNAIKHMTDWALSHSITEPIIIGWDFPYVSQEQINIYHMHGYTAACILPPDFKITSDTLEVVTQPKVYYAIITIKEPFQSPFTLIPNAYKSLMAYMKVNKIKHKESKSLISCFEKTYAKGDICYMDVYIATEIGLGDDPFYSKTNQIQIVQCGSHYRDK